MAIDHYVPQVYLRQYIALFDKERKMIPTYLRDGRRAGPQPIAKLACEEGFYDGHKIDEAWTRSESNWPNTAAIVTSGSLSLGSLSPLLTFLAYQFVRSPAQLNRLSRILQWDRRTVHKVPLNGQSVNAMFMGAIPSDELFDLVLRQMPEIRKCLDTDYRWTLYRAAEGGYFFTSDNPVRLIDKTQEIIFPVTASFLLRGTIRADKDLPNLQLTVASSNKMRRFNALGLKSAQHCIFHPIDSDAIAKLVKAGARPLTLDPLDSGRAWSRLKDL